MQKVEAIILDEFSFSEADKLLTCYTREQGKIVFRARGVRKTAAKHAGALRLFSRTDIYYVEGRNGPLVTDTTLTESFSTMRDSLERLSAAERVAMVLARTLPLGFADMVLWWQLNDYLRVLNEASVTEKDRFTVAPAFFLLTMLRMHGTQPILTQCAVCGNNMTEQDVYLLSPSLGGIVEEECCAKEDDAVALSSGALELLKDWNTHTFQQVLNMDVTPQVQKETVAGVERFAAWHLGESSTLTPQVHE